MADAIPTKSREGQAVNATNPVGRAAATGPVDTVEAVLALLRARGGRVTSSRRLLLNALFHEPSDRTAEELAAVIQAKSPDTNLSTIYRNLDELERLGVILHSHLAHGPATYHLAAQAHGHLVCEECGATIEAPTEFFTGLAKSAQSRYGFHIHPYHFAIAGRCRQCHNHSHQAGAPTQPDPPSPTPGDSTRRRRPPRPKGDQARR